MTWQYLFSTPGAEGKILPWLGRSAAIFHSLRLLVVVLLRRKNFVARCWVAWSLIRIGSAQ
jgi:hypothetical protein